jgi:hypothetical protein
MDGWTVIACLCMCIFLGIFLINIVVLPKFRRTRTAHDVSIIGNTDGKIFIHENRIESISLLIISMNKTMNRYYQYQSVQNQPIYLFMFDSMPSIYSNDSSFGRYMLSIDFNLVKRSFLLFNLFSLGLLCAQRPYLVLLLGLIIIGGLSSGLRKFQVTIDPVQLWSAKSSIARQQKDYFDRHFK